MAGFVQWMRLFRAQTAVATYLLLMVPFLWGGQVWMIGILEMGLFAFLLHYASFGHNSVMDYALGYDKDDPAKQHHPLQTGEISVGRATTVIHWMLLITAMAAIIIAWCWSWAPLWVMSAFLLYMVTGFAYNNGVAKESLSGPLFICISMTALGAFGWYMSHDYMTLNGAVLLLYIFLTILFQIGWSGFLKDMDCAEKSNWIIRMGGTWTVTPVGEVFRPGKSWWFPYTVKVAAILVGCYLFALNYSWMSFIPVVLCIGVMGIMLPNLVEERITTKEKELKAMSIMEVASIFLMMFALLPIIVSLTMAAACIIYFVVTNKVLWGAAYPKV